MEAPKAGEDCRMLYRYVSQLVKETNSLLNMTGVFEGRVRGVMGLGALRMFGNAAELRIVVRGGELDGGTDRQLTNMAIASSDNPSGFGDPVFWAAGVAPDATGTISFFNDGRPFFIGTVSGGIVITPAFSNLESGDHIITANYSGDHRYFSATVSLRQTVSALARPTVQGFASPNPAKKGIDFVTFGANVTGNDPIPPAPQITGDVRFFIDGSNFGDRTLQHLSGDTWRATTADDPINYLDFGDHEIITRYLGDDNYGPASDTFTLHIKDVPDVHLAITPNPAAPNTDVVMSCSVSGNHGVATGTVRFLIEGDLFVDWPLTNGVARLTFNTGVTEGTFTFVGVYLGDDNYAPEASNAVDLVVATESPMPFQLAVSPTGIPIGMSGIFTFEAQNSDGSHNNFNGPVNLQANGANEFTQPAVNMQVNGGQIVQLLVSIFRHVAALNFVNGFATNVQISIGLFTPANFVITNLRLERRGEVSGQTIPGVQWNLD